jgi:hypothetical protein
VEGGAVKIKTNNGPLVEAAGLNLMLTTDASSFTEPSELQIEPFFVILQFHAILDASAMIDLEINNEGRRNVTA